MMDTMGQAAAMTGGYGNSYAASVGNQAYQGYLQKLNEVVPDLYNMAYNMYLQEGEDLKYNYEIADREYNQKYNEYQDAYSNWNNDVNTAFSIAGNESAREQGIWGLNSTAANSILDRVINMFNTNEANNFSAYQQGVQEDQWSKNYALQKDAAKSAELQAGVKRDNNGKIVSVATPSGASDKDLKNIESKLSKISNNGEMDEYLISLEQQGIISEDERADLYAKYRIQEQKGIKDRTWTMTDDGGINWFGIGIDANAKYKDQYGHSYMGNPDKHICQEQNECYEEYKCRFCDYVKKIYVEKKED
jgi:hypothetical protein